MSQYAQYSVSKGLRYAEHPGKGCGQLVALIPLTLSSQLLIPNLRFPQRVVRRFWPSSKNPAVTL